MNRLMSADIEIYFVATSKFCLQQSNNKFNLKQKFSIHTFLKITFSHQRIDMLRVRNYSYAPYLEREGHLMCPMPKPPNIEKKKTWHSDLKTHERLFYHQTLASVRGCKRFKPSAKIPKDSLDFQLQSRYVHSREYFPEKIDFVLQVETCQKIPQTFRVLRNTRDIPLEEPEAIGHPLKIGGIKEKISPDSVKLINSGPHTQLVNNGFSRQPADGNFFRY